MYFFTGSTGTGKSELSKIIMHIFDNIADNVTTKVYCDKTTDFVSVLDSFASTYNDINSHVIVNFLNVLNFLKVQVFIL